VEKYDKQIKQNGTALLRQQIYYRQTEKIPPTGKTRVCWWHTLTLTGATASSAVILAVTAAAATAAAVGIGAGKLDTCIVLGGLTAYNVDKSSLSTVNSIISLTF